MPIKLKWRYYKALLLYRSDWIKKNGTEDECSGDDNDRWIFGVTIERIK